MIVTNEVRLAGCSLLALMMMSISGLAHPSLDGNNQPAPGNATAAPMPANVSIVAAKKRPSFLKRMVNNAGNASWYGAVLNGHKTASGETFDMNQMTACHRTLPFGTMVRVVDTHSGRSVVVRINDRGVLFKDRIIDLSRGAAEQLGIREVGVAAVRLEVLNKKQAEAARIEIAAAGADEEGQAPSQVSEP